MLSQSMHSSQSENLVSFKWGLRLWLQDRLAPMGIFWKSLGMDLLYPWVWVTSTRIQWVCIGGCQIFLASCCKFDNENQTRRTWVSWKPKNPSQQECCLAYSGPLSWLSPLLQAPFSWEHPGSHSLPLLLALASGRSGRKKIPSMFHIPRVYETNNSHRGLRNVLLNAIVAVLLSFQFSRIKTRFPGPPLQWYLITLATLFCH